MNVFLYGRCGIGKSTIIRGVTGELGYEPSGFLTLFGPQNETERSLHIVSARGGDTLTGGNMVARCFPDGTWESYPAVFDNAGVSLLKFCSKPRIVVMDEIGFMESSALRFQKRVLEILDGDYNVLGAIKTEPDTFMQRVYSHPAVKTVEVTEQGRDALLRGLVRIYRGQP